MGVVLGRTDTYQALLDRIAVLERLVRQLSNSNRVGNTSIDAGVLVVRGGALIAEDIDGSPLFYVGQGVVPGVEGSSSAFIQFARGSGQAFFRLNSTGSGDQFWAWYDETGNIIFSDDTVSGQGMARPYVPIPFRTLGSANANGHIGVSAGVATECAIVEGLKQHPRVHIGISGFASDGTTAGTVDVVNAYTGDVIGDVAIVAGTVAPTNYTITNVVVGEHLSQIRLSVRAVRTAGAGSVFVVPRFAYGIQS